MALDFGIVMNSGSVNLLREVNGLASKVASSSKAIFAAISEESATGDGAIAIENPSKKVYEVGNQFVA